MKKISKNYKIILAILTLISVGLIVAGFFVPPLGVVNGSVLTAVGEIFGFSALWVGVAALEKGYDATIKKGDTEITITDDGPSTKL